jgi:Uma2 family endonuclease
MSVETTEHQALYEAVFAHPGAWTEDEYLALPETPARVELVDGVLVVSPLSGSPHQRLTRGVGNVIDATAPNEDWEVYDGLNVRLWPGHLRIPDIVVARRGIDAVTFEAADVLLLGEVTSPGNFRYDRIVKHRDYAAAGIRLYLRVDLESGKEAAEATLFELADGEYREAARSVNGVLRSELPWPFEVDLRAVASGRR